MMSSKGLHRYADQCQKLAHDSDQVFTRVALAELAAEFRKEATLVEEQVQFRLKPI
jgi:hypothetical protein